MDKTTETLFIEMGSELKKQQQVIINLQEKLKRAEGLIDSQEHRLQSLEIKQ